MKDPEFIALRNRFLFGLFIASIFGIALLLVFFYRFQNNQAQIISALQKKESMILVITGKKCDSCQMIEDTLNQKKMKYFTLNKESTSEYEEILNRINFKTSAIKVPTVILIEKGEMSVNKVGITTKEEFLSFLQFHSQTIEEITKKKK